MALISTLLLPVTQPRKTFSQKCFPQVLPTGSLNWRSTTVKEESLDQRGKSDARGKIFEFLAKVIEFPAGKLPQVWLHPRIPGKFIRVLAGTVSQLELSTLSQLLRGGGGGVINRSQSGSWEHRCMGVGLQQNEGKEWGPPALERNDQQVPK